MLLKKALALSVLLLLFPVALLAEDQGRVYVIQKGDTLWGLSQRFVKDPYYWPNLWANNPDIRNPHYIYPGQQVRIYDGRIEIIPANPAAATPVAPVAPETPVATEPAAETPAPSTAPPEIAEEMRITVPAWAGFIDTDVPNTLGEVVDFTDSRLITGEGDALLAKLQQGSDVRVGDQLEVMRKGNKVLHPVTKKHVGNEILDLATVEVVAIERNIATCRIVNSYESVKRSDVLVPAVQVVTNVPLKRAKTALAGFLLSSYSGQIALGDSNVIYVDLGYQDGLEVGNLLNISRERKVSEHATHLKGTLLPELLLGTAVVIDTQEHTATALIVKAIDAIHLGDYVRTVNAE